MYCQQNSGRIYKVLRFNEYLFNRVWVSFKNVALQETCDTLNFNVNYKAQSRSPGFYTAKIIRSRELFSSNKSWPFLVFSWNIPLSFIRFYEAAGFLHGSAIQYLWLGQNNSAEDREWMNWRERRADRQELHQTPSHWQAGESLRKRRVCCDLGKLQWVCFQVESSPSRLLTKCPLHLARRITTATQKMAKIWTKMEFLLPFLPRMLLGAPPTNQKEMQCQKTREKPEDKSPSLC